MGLPVAKIHPIPGLDVSCFHPEPSSLEWLKPSRQRYDLRHGERSLKRNQDIAIWSTGRWWRYSMCAERHMGLGIGTVESWRVFFPLRFFKTGFFCVVLAVLELVL